MMGRQGALATAAGAISFMMAALGPGFYGKTGIRTPGFMAADWLVPIRPDLGSLGEKLWTQFFVDWIFWFAAMWLAYFLIARIGRRPRAPR